MVIGTWLGLHDVAMIALAVALAFVFGYGLAMLPLVRSGMGTKSAIKLALAADSISIATMEIVDNLILVIIPGALNASLSSMLFWMSLATALVIAFVVTVPVNFLLIKRGKGHALVHEQHHHH